MNHIVISDLIETSGQPSPNQFSDIANAGFTTVINLAMHDSTNALPDEGGYVTEAGMAYFHMPVNFNAPTKKDLSLFLKLMKVVEGQKVWVHCALNMRVSAFMQHYQSHVLKRSGDDIIPILKTWEPEDVWLEFINFHKH